MSCDIIWHQGWIVLLTLNGMCCHDSWILGIATISVPCLRTVVYKNSHILSEKFSAQELRFWQPCTVSVHIAAFLSLPTVIFLTPIRVVITGDIHTACNHKQYGWKAWKHNYTLWFSSLTWPGSQGNRKTQRHCSGRWHQLPATGLPGCKCQNRQLELCRPCCTCSLLDTAVHRKSCSSPHQPALRHVNTHIPVESGYNRF